jgi:rubredoxin
MHHKGPESSSRRVVWVEAQNVAGWGCSECAWVFSAAGPFADESFEELKQRFQRQLTEEFAAHDCAEHSRSKRASP